MPLTITQPTAIDELIASVGDDRAMGRVYALRKRQGGGLFMDSLALPSFNKSELTVRMCISTEDVDRQGHVILQNGISKENYRLNPVILWDHGDDYKLPVANSIDLQGQLTVETDGKATWAVAHHVRDDKMSMQIFDAIVCGLLRASSIGVQPISGGKAYAEDGSEILIFDRTDMFEWSYTAIGVQPRAVLRSLKAMRNESFLEQWALQCEAASTIFTRGTLDGQPILPVLRKTLLSILTPGGNQELGFNPQDHKEAKMKKLTTIEIRKLSKSALLKALATPGEYDEATLKAMQDEALVKAELESTPASGEETVETETETTDETPLGARVTASAHEGLMTLIGQIESAMAPVENPTLKDALTEQVNMLRECVASLEGVYSANYPDLPGLAVETEVDDEMVKSFLSQGRYNCQLAGFATRLQSLSKSIGGKHASVLSRTASELNRLHTLAKAHKPKPATDPELEQRVEKFVTGVNDKLLEIKKILDETPAKV